MERIAILGIGLIGGSVGLALKAARPGLEVIGYDTERASAEAALTRGAIDHAAPSVTEAAKDAGLVFLCMPTDVMPETLERLAAAGPDAIVSDVGSAKAMVVEEGERLFGPLFVGGHPMTGSERHGIEAADAALFHDAHWVLTPTALTSSESYAAVAGVVTMLGARPVALNPASHDALVARLSHLPQLAASAIVELAAGAGERAALLGLAGPGFRDVTRIAASDPDLWVAIIKANTKAVVDSLAMLEARLGNLSEAIQAERWGELRDFLGTARKARLELFAKPEYRGRPMALSMMVPDRPGVLAEVTTAATKLGANIEDLRIVHSTEGGRGRLELVVAGEERAEHLVEDLLRLGYHVDRRIE
ncbi:MAG: prephenate dehydrogenase [Actinomycetota bacterium]|nr:prephenate dehydrogenase [Actinomycetota bacterium]